jgi:3-hydroxyisobutyrate dehydrogenase-like beta-hydroxyacid dehydrogenase
LAEDFSPHFAVRAIYKDLHLMQELAKSMKRRAVAAGAAKELYGLAEERGMAGEDFSAVYKVLREM